MKVVKDSTGDVVIYPFLNPDTTAEMFSPYVRVQSDAIKYCVYRSGKTHLDKYSLEEAIQLLKALQEAISIAQVNRHQAQLSADAKAVQE